MLGKLFSFVFLITGAVLYAQDYDTIVLQPGPLAGKDALCWTIDPLSTGGNSIDFTAEEWTYYGTPFSRKGLIEFDLGFLDEDVEIVAANLSLFYNPISPSNTNIIGHSSLSGPNQAYLSRIVSPWKEQEVSFMTLPDITPVNRVLLPQSTSPYQDYLDIEISRMLKDALSEGRDHLGIMIEMVVPEYYRRLLFCSSDHPDPEKWPRLEIVVLDCLAPIAGFSYESEEMTVSFSSTSLNADHYFWDFGNGYFSNVESPSCTYEEPIEYSVCLRVENDCGIDTYCEVISLCKLPDVCFECTSNGLEIKFQNLTSECDSVVWDFGNGFYSCVPQPVYSFDSAGTYEICLSAMNECGWNSLCDSVKVEEANEPPEEPFLIQLYPNPAVDQTYVEINESGAFQMIMYSIDGKLIFEDQIQNTPGEKNTILTETLLPGVYILLIKNDYISKRFNLVKVL